MVGDFHETPHQTQDDTDSPRPLRRSEAGLRLACPPLAWRNGAAHEKGAGGESDPPFLCAGAAPGRVKGDRQNDTFTLPSRGRCLHSDPCGKAIRLAEAEELLPEELPTSSRVRAYDSTLFSELVHNQTANWWALT